MKQQSVLPDEDSLRLIPDDWWLLIGTVRGGDTYNAKRYEKEWRTWMTQVRKKFVKTDAELLWFYRIANDRDEGMAKEEWHIHFFVSGKHIEKQVEEIGGRKAAATYLRNLWPSGANKDIQEYERSHMGTNEWGAYLNKVTPHDKIETFTKFSAGLKKEIIRRRKAAEKTVLEKFSVSSEPTQRKAKK